MAYFCSPFAQRIAAFEDTLAGCKALLEDYVKRAQKQTLNEARQRLASLMLEREEFFQRHYIPAVETLYKKWDPKEMSPDDFSHFFRITVRGRIELHTFLGGMSVDWGATYFPHLIERVESLGVRRSGFEEMNHLEIVSSLTVDDGSRVRILGRLKKIERGFMLKRYDLMSLSFPQLEEIGGPLLIETGIAIESFRPIFPQLRKVGANSHFFSSSGSTIAIKLTPDRAHLRDEILRLQQEGSLEIEGAIVIDD